MLSRAEEGRRKSLLERLASSVTRLHTLIVGQWVARNWCAIEDQHLKLIQHLKDRWCDLAESVFDVSGCVEALLDLSLGVMVGEIPPYIDYSRRVFSLPSGQLLLRAICSSPNKKLPKLSFSDFTKLVHYVMAPHNWLVVEACERELTELPLPQWQGHIEAKKACSNVADTTSVQSFLAALVKAYGPVAQALSMDLLASEDARFSHCMHHAQSSRPNNKQFALAQYCVANLASNPRQLWCVPWGGGKSRIVPTAGVIAYLTKTATEIHIVYENKHLMQRDQSDFVCYW
jgi:hypothetical protein